MFSQKSRVEMIKDSVNSLKNIEVDNFSGLLVDYAKIKKASVIIRGIRALSDYEYEFNMALMNRSLEKTITTTFLVAHQNLKLLKNLSKARKTKDVQLKKVTGVPRGVAVLTCKKMLKK